MERNIDLSKFSVTKVLAQKADTIVERIQFEGKNYILKSFIREKILADERKIALVTNERDILKEISFPNINALVTTTKSDERLCLVLNLAKGVDIVQFLLSIYKCLPEPLVSLIVAQLIYALDYLHSQMIAYKDLKAQHVFLSRKLRVELIDMGLAEQLSEGDYLTAIASGTLHSMSPEMAKLYIKSLEKQEIDYQQDLVHFVLHDLYTVGILTYECLFGKAPYGYFNKQQNGESSEAKIQYLQQIIKSGLDFQQLFKDKQISKECFDFLQQLLNQDPKARFPFNPKSPSILPLLDHPFFKEDIKTLAHELVFKKELDKVTQHYIYQECKDIIDYIDIQGVQNDSDIEDDEKLDEESQKIFAAF